MQASTLAKEITCKYNFQGCSTNLPIRAIRREIDAITTHGAIFQISLSTCLTFSGE